MPGVRDKPPLLPPLLQGLGAGQKDITPRLGGSVQVLYGDGHWYNGKLVGYDEGKGQWDIQFEDGDRDWFTLPDRDVRILRDRATGSWAAFLKRFETVRPTPAREQQREIFLACQPSEPAQFRKPADLFAEGSQLHNPNPGTSMSNDLQWPGQSNVTLDVEEDEPHPRNSAFSVSGPHKRRRGNNQLPEGLKNSPHAGLYGQLLEMERRIDAVFARETLGIDEILKDPPSCRRIVQLCVYNTFSCQPARTESQSGQGEGLGQAELQRISGADAGSMEVDGQHGAATPSWTLFLTGRILPGSVDEQEPGAEEPFCHLLDSVLFELPTDTHARSSSVSWIRESNAETLPRGFRLRRQGSHECSVKIKLHRWRSKGRISLSSSELSALLGFESGTTKALLLAFWNYVKQNGLQDDRDILYVRLDEPLQKIFKESRIPMTRVLEKLQSFTVDAGSVEFDYRVQLGQGGAGRSPAVVVEFEVGVEAPVIGRMRECLEGLNEEASPFTELDREVAELIDEIDLRKRKHDFFERISDNPVSSLKKVTEGLALDLSSIRNDSSGPYGLYTAEESRRFQKWQESWVEEASLHYLWSQGYDVPVLPIGTLLEQDATAFAHSAVSAASVAANALASTTLPLLKPALPKTSLANGLKSTVSDRRPHCSKCKRFFSSQGALSAHLATSAAHKEDSEQRRTASWFPHIPMKLAAINRVPTQPAQPLPHVPAQLPSQPSLIRQQYKPQQPLQQLPQSGQLPVSVSASPHLAGQATQQLPQAIQQQWPQMTFTSPQSSSRPGASPGGGMPLQQHTLWNQIQMEAKGKGLTMEQMREIYKKRQEEQKQQQHR